MSTLPPLRPSPRLDNTTPAPSPAHAIGLSDEQRARSVDIVLKRNAERHRMMRGLPLVDEEE